jgi:hypothetical protein
MFARVLSAFWVAATSCVAMSQPSVPSSADRSWMLGVGAQADEDGNESTLAALHWGVARGSWLSFSAGQSSSPADRADVEASTLAVDFDRRFDTVGFTLGAERWGDSGVLETRAFSGSVYFDNDRWRVGVGYQTRDIDIPFTLTGPLGGTLQRSVSLDAGRYSLDARTALGERWALYFGIAEHDYERDLAALPRIERFNLLSGSTLTLAQSFIDHERSIGLEREFERLVLNLRAATDRSAVDGSRLDTLDAALLVPLGRRVDLEVNLGKGRSDLFDAGFYGGLLLLVYGR